MTAEVQNRNCARVFVFLSMVAIENDLLNAWISLAVALVASALFITKWIPMEVTALCIPVVLFVTGVFDDAGLALQGFGSPAVITLASILVVAAGLQESGFARFIAKLPQNF